MNWLKRNWMLTPMILAVLVIILNGLASYLPDLPSLKNLEFQQYPKALLVLGALVLLLAIWKKQAFFAIAIVFLGIVFFAEDIFGFDWTLLSIGRWIESAFGQGSSKWTILILLVALAIAWLLFGKKKKAGGGSAPWSFFDISFVWGFLSVILIISVIVGSIFSPTIDKWLGCTLGMEKQCNAELPTELPKECMDEKKAKQFRIDEAYKDIVICKGSRGFHLYPIYEHRLEFVYSPSFYREHKHLLQRIKKEQFVAIFNPGTFPGSIAESYLVAPIWDKAGKPSGFEASGLDQIVLRVRAVK